MIGLADSVVVVITSFYFIALAVVSWASPAVASRFLLGHAAGPSVRYLELFVLLTVGAAFVLRAPRMLFSPAFKAFGWVLVTTTVVLLAVPWHWHHRFAQRLVPQVLGYLNVIAIASLALGSLIPAIQRVIPVRTGRARAAVRRLGPLETARQTTRDSGRAASTSNCRSSTRCPVELGRRSAV
jgi:hypothetical protein